MAVREEQMTTDPYPTRVQQPREWVPRKDPIVHARNEHRWDGPLDEVALLRYERDGFLRRPR